MSGVIDVDRWGTDAHMEGSSMDQTLRPGVSRRQVLIMGGGLAGVVGLAACSGGDESVPDAFGNGGGTDLMESPMLTEQVEAGELPELTERLPADPMVIEPWETVGRFGGTLNRATSSDDSMVTHWAFAHAGLLEWNWEGDGPMPSLAAEYERDESNTTFTFTLRDGLKWSDGEPFTTDDIEFAWEGIFANETLRPIPPAWLSNPDGTLAELDIADDLTFSVRFSDPAPLFERYMCFPRDGLTWIMPKHYLSQFHPEYASAADVDELVVEAGVETWDQLFSNHDAPQNDSELPVMGAYWGTGILDSQGTGVMERNAYYWKTDPDGRQLPYIDTVQLQALEQETLDLRAANGDLEFQGYQLGYNSTRVFIDNAEDRGYRVDRWTLEDGAVTLFPNLSHPDEDVRALFHELDFRVALSISIDREDLNDTLLGGLGESRQPLPTERSDYYIEGTGQQHLQYDVEEANRLLDGLGLERAEDGLRTLPDGSPLSFVVISMPGSDGIPMSDVLARVAAYWEEIGIELIHQQMENTLYSEMYQSNEYDIDASNFLKTENWDLEPVWFVPTGHQSHSMPAYGRWYATGGGEGMEPPDDVKELLGYWEDLTSAPTDEERIAAGQNIVQHHEDNLYMIGVIEPTFHPVIVHQNVRNIRDDAPLLSNFLGREAITKPEQAFFVDGD